MANRDMGYSGSRYSVTPSMDSGYVSPQERVQGDSHSYTIPVMVSGGTRYSSGTYPGVRSTGISSVSAGHQSYDDIAMKPSQVHNIPMVHQGSPNLSRNFRTSVLTQVGNSQELGHPNFGSGSSLNNTNPVTVVPVQITSPVVPHWNIPESMCVINDRLPMPVTSQLVYTTRLAPGGSSQSGLVGKTGIASSRRTAFTASSPGESLQSGSVSRQIPVQVLSSQSARQDVSLWESKPFQEIKINQEPKSYQDSKTYQLKPAIDRSPAYSSQSLSQGGTLQRSSSVDSSKEAEVDALTDLLVQNMSVAGNPDFYGMCVKCGRSIMGENAGCTALEQLYHVECFRCGTCNNLLRGQPFYAMEGRPFCECCYMLTLEKCSVCSKPIIDRMLRATGKPYHPTCFNCVVCGKNLDGTTFTVDATNQIHCIDDFHRKFAPRCCVCSLPMMPSPGEDEAIRIVVLDRSFHVNCFRCEDCGIVLSSESDGRGCYPLDDHILCKSCNARRIQAMTMKATTDL